MTTHGNGQVQPNNGPGATTVDTAATYTQSNDQQPQIISSGGESLRTGYDARTGVFDHVFRHSTPIEPTEIYLPRSQYPTGFEVQVTDGEYEVDQSNERLLYRHSDKAIPHFIRIIPTPPRAPLVQPFWPPRIALGLMGLLFVLYLLPRQRK